MKENNERIHNELQRLIEQAKDVLESNWIGDSTKPAPDLYPHQWNWDSGFIAIGYAHYHPERGRRELNSLFDAQWDNGMVPQIVFNESALGGYFPEPDFWQCERSPDAPEHVRTSGIAQPPVHAMAARKLYELNEEDDQTHDWLEAFLPKLKRSHRYFYEHRDPNDEGLVYIRHPWESGLDNSPAWDPSLEAIDLDQVTVPDYQRKDLDKEIPEEQRPTDETYDRYVYLLDLFRERDYVEEDIYPDCPFLVQDPMFNAILSKANEDLIYLCEEFGVSCDQIRGWDQRTRERIRTKLWHEEKEHFDPYDLAADRHIDVMTTGDFFPLLCGAATEGQAERLYEHLDSKSFCSIHQETCFSVPNYNMLGEDFDPDNYWRGPVWINVNWLLMHGLYRYGYEKKARAVREDIVELISQFGFHEYFDPKEGTGYGTDQFSWSAALFIDVAEEIRAELKEGTHPEHDDLCAYSS